METKRQANFELLRIVAMLMILVLHYLSRGQIIADGDMDQWTAVECAAYLIRAFCIVPVNCYVLVSGYFLVQSPWKPGRIVTIAGQLLFYSLLVPAVLLCIGAVPFGSLTVYDWLNYLLPVETEHYWFGTAYLLMYVFAPFLAAGVRAVQKRTLQIALGVLGLYFCVWKSVLPVHLATDRSGYEFGWFLFLFLLAAYIRLYGCPLLEQKSHAAALYIGMSIGIFCLVAGTHALARTTGSKALAYYAGAPWSYNHIFCLLASVGFFMWFKDMKAWEGRWADGIVRLAPYSFGVYLLHEHLLMRTQWMEWLGSGRVRTSFLFIPHMVLCAVLVYLCGTAADAARAWMFRRIGKIAAHHEKGKS